MVFFIYIIENQINGKAYIGQTTNPGRRERAHLRQYGGGTALGPAIRKYGAEAFSFTLLECCQTQEEVNLRESYWLEELGTLSPNGYNLVVYQPVKAVCLETRMKMAAWQVGKCLSEEHKEKIGNAGRGRVFTPEHRAKIAAARMKEACGRGHAFTPENTTLTQRSDGRIQRICRACRREKYRKAREV